MWKAAHWQPQYPRVFGVPDTTWYAEPRFALPFLVIVYVYMYIGLYVIVFVGGIENVPVELHEAAKVDGAGYVPAVPVRDGAGCAGRMCCS